MDPKKGSDNTTGKGKREVVKTTRELKGIVDKVENGVQVSDLNVISNLKKFYIKRFSGSVSKGPS